MYSEIAEPPGGSAPSDWLTFCVDTEEYGIDILRVQEIRSFENPTRLINTAACVLGVLDLRGQIVPLVDLHRLFGNKPLVTVSTPVVIFAILGRQIIGLVVSSVTDVVRLTDEHMRAAPSLANGTASHVQALARYEDRTLVLTQVDKLVDMSRGCAGPSL